MKNKGKLGFFDVIVVFTILFSLAFTSITVSSTDNGIHKDLNIMLVDSSIFDKEYQRIISTLNDDVCDDCDDDTDPSTNRKPSAIIYQINPNPGKEHESIFFEGYGEDSDGEIVEYLWQSDIDGDLSTEPSFSTSSLTAGIHKINFSVKDDGNLWSDKVNISLEILENMPPNPPFIAGDSKGKPGEEVEFSFITSDPEQQSVLYYVEWGDGSTSGWSEVHNSDEEVIMIHTWEQRGDYLVRAKAKDIHEKESDWATLEIQMPKTSIFENFFTFFMKNIFENLHFFE
jgi:hypothetical protein